MKLPVILPDLKAQQWDCHGCTNCCRELVVHLTPRDVEEIERQGWRERMPEPPYIRLGRERVLNHRPGGGCVFLTDDGRCRIHAEFGADAKPLACQLYPFTLHRESESIRADIRFDCPSAAANHGSPLSSHRKDVNRLASSLEDAGPAILSGGRTKPRLTSDRELTFDEQAALVSRVDGWLRDANRPLVDRLLGLHHLVRTLARARLSKVRDEHFVELLDMLLLDAPAAVEELRATGTQSPSSQHVKLLRMTLFAHCEYIDLSQARRSFLAGLSYRMEQLRRARRFVAGQGAVPRLAPGCHGGTMADVDRVTSDESVHRATEELIARYLRARLLCGTAFGSGYYDWAAVDGLHAMLLAVCCVDWLARYFAVTDGRTRIGIEDARRAVGVVDRTAGRARELGTRTALMRVRHLASDGGMERLLKRSVILHGS